MSDDNSTWFLLIVAIQFLILFEVTNNNYWIYSGSIVMLMWLISKIIIAIDIVKKRRNKK